MASSSPPARKSNPASGAPGGTDSTRPSSEDGRRSTIKGFPPTPDLPTFDSSYRGVSSESGTTPAVKPITSRPPGSDDSQGLKAEVRKLSRHNLKLQSDLLFMASTLESLSDAVVVADHLGMILSFNDAAATLLQVEKSEALKDNLFRLLFDDQEVMPRGDGGHVLQILREQQRVDSHRTEIAGKVDRKPVPVLLTLNYVRASDPPAIVAIIKNNSELEKLMRTDHLTGIANRGEFDARLLQECSRMDRGQMSMVSMLFMDVDLFKSFNTKYGHQGGDEVLKAVGRVLKECVRDIDTPARYGGEEFAVILPGTDEVGAIRVAERIRRRLEATKVFLQGYGDVSVTVSIGVSTRLAKGSDPESLTSEANEAMRLAKEQGRNRTRIFARKR